MSHRHINDKGEFQSDKHPELPPDRIRLNFQNKLSWRALWALAEDYERKDPDLARDIQARLTALGYHTLDCRADDPMDCAALQMGEDPLQFALDQDAEECACACHQVPA